MRVISASEYYDASRQRHQEAFKLMQEGEYGLSIYVQGLSIECMLRAYMTKEGEEFHQEHDLQKFLRLSKLTSIHNDSIRIKLMTRVTDIYQLWDNVFRFYPDRKLILFYKANKFDRKIKGDTLKFLSKKIYEAGTEIIKLGVNKWNN